MSQGFLPLPLLEILVCPVCHAKVDAGPAETNQAAAGHDWLHCRGCGRYYPVQDGIPVMLEARATMDVPDRSPRS